MKFLGLVSLIAVFGLVQGGSVHILDEESQSIGAIVQQVCSHTTGTGKQISKISTVSQIAEYLKSLPADDKLAACSRVYLDSVTELANLVSISNNDVCSDEKISAIQQFHRNYIVKGPRSVGKAPKVLATFFYHYVHSVAEICARETVGFLQILDTSSEVDTNEIDRHLAELTGKMGVSSSSNLRYQDIYLVWTILEMLPLRDQHKLEKYLFEGEKRVVMAVKSGEVFYKLQEFCATKAKPLYSHSLLATMRLIDMGYYPFDSDVSGQLNSNKQARRLYELTRVCEAILPVRVVEQSARPDSDIVFLSRDEVSTLGLSEAQKVSAVEREGCKRCAFEGVDSLPTVNSVDASPIAKAIKSDIKSRKSSISRLLKIFVKNVKSNIGSKIKKLFSGESFEELENMDDANLEIYDVSDGDDSDSSVHRAKRGLGTFLWKTATFMVFLIVMSIWMLVRICVFFPILGLYLLYALITQTWHDNFAYFLLSGGRNLSDWIEEHKIKKLRKLEEEYYRTH